MTACADEITAKERWRWLVLGSPLRLVQSEFISLARHECMGGLDLEIVLDLS